MKKKKNNYWIGIDFGNGKDLTTIDGELINEKEKKRS